MKKSENYLERLPVHPSHIRWDADEKGIVTLCIENKGIMKKLTQTLLGKPKVSNIHLDELGSFVWCMTDGERNITEIGFLVKAHFGEAAEPVYERLARFFQILDSYGFIEWKTCLPL